MKKPEERLREARERLGISQRELASALGISVPSYYDLEDSDDLTDTISLDRLSKLCSLLSVDPRFLFSGTRTQGLSPAVSFDQLAEQVSQYMRKRNIDRATFEGEAGWALGEFLTRPQVAREWNVQCLIDVSTLINVNWLDVLGAWPWWSV
jgi:transcriptional regulator with XRE-family HTH domain